MKYSKETKFKIFKRAHEQARKTVSQVGNYSIALKLALIEQYGICAGVMRERAKNEISKNLRNVGAIHLKVESRGLFKEDYSKEVSLYIAKNKDSIVEGLNFLYSNLLWVNGSILDEQKRNACNGKSPLRFQDAEEVGHIASSFEFLLQMSEENKGEDERCHWDSSVVRLVSKYAKLFRKRSDSEVAKLEYAYRVEVEKRNKKMSDMINFLGGLPLQGTEKQVLWAEQIRYNFIKNLDESRARKILKFKKYAKSKFWIENRDKLGSAVCS